MPLSKQLPDLVTPAPEFIAKPRGHPVPPRAEVGHAFAVRSMDVKSPAENPPLKTVDALEIFIGGFGNRRSLSKDAQTPPMNMHVTLLARQPLEKPVAAALKKEDLDSPDGVSLDAHAGSIVVNLRAKAGEFGDDGSTTISLLRPCRSLHVGNTAILDGHVPCLKFGMKSPNDGLAGDDGTPGEV